MFRMAKQFKFETHPLTIIRNGLGIDVDFGKQTKTNDKTFWKNL